MIIMIYPMHIVVVGKREVIIMKELTVEQEFTQYKHVHMLNCIKELHKYQIREDLYYQRQFLDGVSEEEVNKIVEVIAKGFTNAFLHNASSEQIYEEYNRAWQLYVNMQP